MNKIVKKPPFLSSKARKYWDFLLGELRSTEGFRDLDTYQLAILSNALNDYGEATSTLEKEGKFYKTGSGLIRLHPANQIQNDALKTIKEIGGSFGLNFRSRENLSRSYSSKEKMDDLDKILN